MVTCVPRTVYSTICTTDVTYWPYDVVECSVVVGAWMKTADEITINNDWGKVSIYQLIIQRTFIVTRAVALLVEALRYTPVALLVGALRYKLVALLVEALRYKLVALLVGALRYKLVEQLVEALRYKLVALLVEALRYKPVVQLVGALRYKPEGCIFSSWRCHCELSLT